MTLTRSIILLYWEIKLKEIKEQMSNVKFFINEILILMVPDVSLLHS
jgi:hypothetical protein